MILIQYLEDSEWFGEQIAGVKVTAKQSKNERVTLGLLERYTAGSHGEQNNSLGWFGCHSPPLSRGAATQQWATAVWTSKHTCWGGEGGMPLSFTVHGSILKCSCFFFFLVQQYFVAFYPTLRANMSVIIFLTVSSGFSVLQKSLSFLMACCHLSQEGVRGQCSLWLMAGFFALHCC